VELDVTGLVAIVGERVGRSTGSSLACLAASCCRWGPDDTVTASTAARTTAAISDPIVASARLVMRITGSSLAQRTRLFPQYRVAQRVHGALSTPRVGS